MLYGGIVFLVLAERASAGYNIDEIYGGQNFFDNFGFFTLPDPTNGYVDYVSRSVAFDKGLAYVNDKGQAVMKVDSDNVAWGRGRQAVRLFSKKTYTRGLFIFDVEHMPASVCGSWPAYWTNGEFSVVPPKVWPATGEIDIIEYVNKDTYNAGTLHTSPGCEARGNADAKLKAKACGAGGGYQGCGWKEREGKYAGDPVNAAGGGVYVGEWDFVEGRPIRLWYFLRGEVPQDITDGNPQPWTWKKPNAEWTMGNWCPKNKFTPQRFIINTTFCGGWAGGVWHSGGCAQQTGYNSCDAYVRENPQVFKDSYWTVNHLKIYQWRGGEVVRPGPGIPAPGPAGCLKEYNTDFYGGDIANGFLTASDMQNCAETCRANAQCRYWTFQPSTNNCWMKDSKAGQTGTQDRISGNEACGADAPAPSSSPAVCGVAKAGADECVGHIKWAMDNGRWTNPEWYSSFYNYVDRGNNLADATAEDFQMFFFCDPYFADKENNCGFPVCNRKCKGGASGNYKGGAAGGNSRQAVSTAWASEWKPPSGTNGNTGGAGGVLFNDVFGDREFDGAMGLAGSPGVGNVADLASGAMGMGGAADFASNVLGGFGGFGRRRSESDDAKNTGADEQGEDNEDSGVTQGGTTQEVQDRF